MYIYIYIHTYIYIYIYIYTHIDTVGEGHVIWALHIIRVRREHVQAVRSKFSRGQRFYVGNRLSWWLLVLFRKFRQPVQTLPGELLVPPSASRSPFGSVSIQLRSLTASCSAMERQSCNHRAGCKETSRSRSVFNKSEWTNGPSPMGALSFPRTYLA